MGRVVALLLLEAADLGQEEFLLPLELLNQADFPLELESHLLLLLQHAIFEVFQFGGYDG